MAEPRVVDIEEVPELADVLPDMCKRYREILDTEAALKKEKKDIGDQIVALMQAVNVKTVIGDTWQSTVGSGCNVTIVKELLVQAGVSLETVAKATRRSPYYYPVISKREVEG